MFLNDETIAAIATPIGEGGISIVRISGAKAVEIADRSFRGREPLGSVATHTAHFGIFVNNGESVLDQVVATVFRKPHSYTGEDVVEISCHGGIFLTRSVLGEILNNGARLAEPGEFTKRAFLSGKMDLSQAEAVADLIHARSETAHRVSIQQLQGRLSVEIDALREKLIHVISLMELELDFTEEGLEFVQRPKIMTDILDVEARIRSIVGTFTSGKIYREGVRVVLVGPPNVGKSSVFNGLLSTNRAIVTDIPGTTRDVIEESINLDGIIFTLSDTAGLRESSDVVEKEGILRAESQRKNADIILLILDLSRDMPEENFVIYNRLSRENEKLIIVRNKCDLMKTEQIPPVPEEFDKNVNVVLSAKTGYGFDDLKRTLSDMAMRDVSLDVDKSITVTNMRHVYSLRSAADDISHAKESLQTNLTGEFIVPDLRSACNSLGEIIGKVTSDDILNNIFSRFCIGK